jgi:hypothetical protein
MEPRRDFAARLEKHIASERARQLALEKNALGYTYTLARYLFDTAISFILEEHQCAAVIGKCALDDLNSFEFDNDLKFNCAAQYVVYSDFIARRISLEPYEKYMMGEELHLLIRGMQIAAIDCGASAMVNIYACNGDSIAIALVI